VQCKN